MQSKTSCFNKTIFRKHVTRFWPVWAAYLAVWLLDMPIGFLSQRESLRQFPLQVQSGALQAVNSGVVISFIFAVLMAMAVWSFLYNSRSASGAAWRNEAKNPPSSKTRGTHRSSPSVLFANSAWGSGSAFSALSA